MTRSVNEKVVVFALTVCCALSLRAATIDLADKGGAYTLTIDDLQTDFVNTGADTAVLTFNFGNSDVNYSGVISGDIKVVKKGSGTASFAKANPFAGGISVESAGGAVLCGVDNALGSGLITLASGGYVKVSSGAICPNDVYIAGGTGYIAFGSNGGTYSGNINGASGVTVAIAKPASQGNVNKVTGAITIPNGTMNMGDGQACYVSFYGPVKVATVVQESAYHRTAPYFFSTENEFGCLRLIHKQNATYTPYFAAGAIPHECCITGNVTTSKSVLFDGDQRMRYVTAAEGNKVAMSAQTQGALTLTASGNGPYVLFNGNMDLTYAPDDGGAWTLTNGTSTMTGALTVSNAVMTVDQAASFKGLTKAVVLAGAELRVLTSVANAFAALTDLTVSGTVEIGDAVNAPFSSSLLTVRMEGAGKLKVPSGRTLDLPFLTVAGGHVPSGVYTSANCSWITGEGSVNVANRGISSWADAVDGNWSDAEKWFDQVVPGYGNTFVTANRADYTVRVDVPVLKPAKTLVGSTSGCTSTVAVVSDVRLDSATSVVEVVRGGVFDVRSGTFTSSNTSSRVCKVTDGGIWRVSGGTCNFRTKVSSFQVVDGGRLEVLAGEVSLQDIRYGYDNPFDFNNGIIDITGGKLCTVNAVGEFNPLGSGEITVGGTGTLSIARGWMGPRTAGKRLHIVTKGGGVFTSGGVMAFGDTLTGGETLIELNSTNTCQVGPLTCVGCNRACRVQVDINTGASLASGGWAVRLGAIAEKKDSIDCAPTGIVNVVGGTCTLPFDWYGKDYGDAGLSVGGGFSVSASYACSQYGELNLSSAGKYVQTKGVFAVGLAQGEGRVVVDGASTLSKSGSGEALIGVFGGKGALIVRGGGKATFAGKMYVGGVEQSSLEQTAGIDVSAFKPTDAVGTVDVSTGELTVGGTLVLGEKGSGTLRIGSDAQVFARNFEMRGTTSSSLDFTFGASGVGAIVVTETATISPQAKIRVDLTGYSGELKRALLIMAPTVTGRFEEGNVTIVGLKDASLVYRADGIYVKGPSKGLAVIVR